MIASPIQERTMNPYFNLNDKVGDTLEKYPELIDAMVGEGFLHLADPRIRATKAKQISFYDACEHHGKDPEALEKLLVETIEKSK